MVEDSASNDSTGDGNTLSISLWDCGCCEGDQDWYQVFPVSILIPSIPWYIGFIRSLNSRFNCEDDGC